MWPSGLGIAGADSSVRNDPAPTLTLTDAQAIEELPSVTAAAPSSPGTAQLVYGPNNWSTQITGTTPTFLTVRDWQLSAGYPFADSDVRSATQVALLGQTVVVDYRPGAGGAIGAEVGYKDTAYFCRRFKMMFGIPAGKMRRRESLMNL